MAAASLCTKSHLTPTLARWTSCSDIDLPTTERTLSLTSAAILLVLLEARSLVNQVLCSRAEMMQMRSRWSRCSKSVRHSSCESWE